MDLLFARRRKGGPTIAFVLPLMAKSKCLIDFFASTLVHGYKVFWHTYKVNFRVVPIGVSCSTL